MARYNLMDIRDIEDKIEDFFGEDLISPEESGKFTFSKRSNRNPFEGELVSLEGDPNFPRFNWIKTGKNSFRINLALAGFNKDELRVFFKGPRLVIEGEKIEKEDKGYYLHRGISYRAFETSFRFRNDIKVNVTDLFYENGILTIDLQMQRPQNKEEIKELTIGTKNS